MRSSLFGLASLAGIAMITAAPPAPAEDVRSVVRTLDAIMNPEDAWRLEDQARRYRHRREEHYWHDYGDGLERQRREHGEGGPQYGAPGRYLTPIDPDEAQRLEDQARRYGRPNTERYWEQYRQGSGGSAGPR